MAHLIEKDSLVAEIKHHLQFTPEHTNAFIEGEEHAYNKILSFIDTLEVKEVDLEKEIDLVEDKYQGFYSLSRADIIEIAKHFFEFGLKASCSVDLTPDLDTLFEEKGIDPDSKEAKVFKESYYIALEKLKAQKG